jgi:hypothetical protein
VIAVSCGLAGAIACSRPKAAPGADAAPAASASAASAASQAAPTEEPPAPREVSVAPAPSLEARRATLARVEEDRALAANADTLRKHFGGAIPSGLVVQTADLSLGRRRAILVADGGKTGIAQSQPMVLVVDQAGVLQWTKEHPAGGIMPPVGQLAIASAPRGRVALVACDPPTSSVALREWDDDGTAFADFQAMDIEACEAVSVLFWPKHGWVIAASRQDGTRAQLVSSEGRLSWGRGIPLGARWRTTAPVALAADTDDSFILVQYAGPDADHALAYRYDATGAPLWPNAIDLGEVRRVGPAEVRIPLTLPRPGIVRIKLAAAEIDLASSGEIVRRH